MTPPEAIADFFAKLSDADCTWLSNCCAFRMSDSYSVLASRTEAESWLTNHLMSVNLPELKFGRVLHLIAVLDFELSPPAAKRLEARARSMAEAPISSMAEEGRAMLRDRVPQVKDLVEKWQDVRRHELDEASLWVYRDSLASQGLAETRRQIGPTD